MKDLESLVLGVALRGSRVRVRGVGSGCRVWGLWSKAYDSGCSSLGGPWDLVTTYNWAYNLTYNPPKWAYRGHPNYT